MCVKNRFAALVFRVALIIGCCWGITEMSGLFHGGFSSRMLAYYTNLSDLAVLVFTITAAVHTIITLIRHGNRGSASFLPRLKRALVLAISVTLLVYHFVLGPTMYRMNVNYEVYGLTDLLIHYFTPIMFILDWFLFDEKNKTRWYDPILWLLLPISYLVFVLIRAEVAEPLNAVGVRYPYYFLDVDALGAKLVAGYVTVCLLAFTALGYVIAVIDKLSSMLFKHRKVAVEVLETEGADIYGCTVEVGESNDQRELEPLKK